MEQIKGTRLPRNTHTNTVSGSSAKQQRQSRETRRSSRQADLAQQDKVKNLHTDLALFIKINSKWIRGLKAIKLLEDNVGENLDKILDKIYAKFRYKAKSMIYETNNRC